jgi:hypothetical protein
MTMTPRLAGTLLASLLLTCGAGLSGAQAQSSRGGSADNPRQVENASGIQYITGGVGDESEQQLQQQIRSNHYNLKLVFTLNPGNYVSDVNVAIKDERGRTLVEDVADGPFFVAKIPPGTYTVSASYEGKTDTRKIRIGNDALRTAHFRFPANPGTDFTDTARGRNSERTTSAGS